MNDDDLWRKIEALARQQEPAIQQAVLAAFAALRQVVDLDTLTAAVEQGWSAVMALFPDEAVAAAFQSLPKALHGVAVATGTAEAASVARWLAALTGTAGIVAGGAGSGVSGLLGGVGGIGGKPLWSPKVMHFNFDSLNPQVIQAVQQQAATLVQQVTQQTKDAIKEQVRVGMLFGENPRETARAIRQGIGLTAKQQVAVANFRQELMTFHERESAGAWNLGGKISRAPGGAQTFAVGPDGKLLDAIQARRLRDFRFDKTLQKAMQDGKPLTQKQIDAMVTAYERKYLKYRSENIARTEALRASNIAIHATWQQAIDAGLVEEDGLRRVWHVGHDERLCLQCQGVKKANPEGRAFDEPFVTLAGEAIHLPPLHPSCRCRVFVKLIA